MQSYCLLLTDALPNKCAVQVRHNFLVVASAGRWRRGLAERHESEVAERGVCAADIPARVARGGPRMGEESDAGIRGEL